MLEEYLLDIGFSEKDIKKVNKFFPKKNYSEATILYNFRNLERFFRRNHINRQEFIYITLTVPNILNLGIENINSKIKILSSLGFNKIDFFSILKKYPYFIEFNFDNIQSKIEILSSYSFANDDAVSIFVRVPDILKNDNKSLINHLQLFENIGFNQNEIRHMIMIDPSLLLEDESIFYEQIHQLNNMGFMDYDIIKISFYVPELLTNFYNTMQKKFQKLLLFGFSEIEIVQMIKITPYLLEDQILNNIDDILSNIKRLGFKNDEIIFMCNKNPYILLYSEDRIVIRFHELLNIGFNKEDVTYILKKCPILFGYRYLTINDKISFYQEIGLFSIIREHPNVLLHNLDKIKNRYFYLKDIDKISAQNYHLLFLTSSDFYNKYNISDIDLMKGD